MPDFIKDENNLSIHAWPNSGDKKIMLIITGFKDLEQSFSYMKMEYQR